jgi:alkanesulfonate monooxygenase SsuD/methylene tetrahydromethanopterin reductase-like flavin-dependent oxidoreductase (luciferase family)
MWIGGNTTRALQRAARRGDGWLAVYQTHDEIARKWDQLRELTIAAGRDPSNLTLAHQMRFFVNDEHYPEAPPGVGPAGKVADDIARFAELGVQHLELAPPPGPTTDAILTQLRRFADEVRPRLPATV